MSEKCTNCSYECLHTRAVDVNCLSSARDPSCTTAFSSKILSKFWATVSDIKGVRRGDSKLTALVAHHADLPLFERQGTHAEKTKRAGIKNSIFNENFPGKKELGNTSLVFFSLFLVGFKEGRIKGWIKIAGINKGTGRTCYWLLT